MHVEDTVVVGVEACRPDRGLLGWAAEEAVARRARLTVCHVWEWNEPEHGPRSLLATVPAEPTPAERNVRAMACQVREWFPDLDVSVVFGPGRPARTLLRMSERAGLIVVGARGRGGFPGLLLGSVPAQLAAHADCPVAVVRPPSTTAGSDVVAGVDGWPDSEPTARLALEEARRLGGRLILVHGYRLPPPAEYGPDAGIDEPHRRALAQDLVERAAKDLAATADGVDVQARAAHGAPTAVLLAAAADAAALVVGTRGAGGFAGLALGSVSQQVLRHAPCTVVVAR